MLGQDEILAALKAKGVSSAEIGRVIGKPSSRVAEMYGGRRKLQLDEAVKLAGLFELDGHEGAATPNAEILLPLFDAVIRRLRTSRASASLSQVLAQA